MAFRQAPIFPCRRRARTRRARGAAVSCPSQVFVVGEKTATADIATDFHATRVELSSKPLNELGRRELIRDLEAEQGFAHRPLPLGRR